MVQQRRTTSVPASAEAVAAPEKQEAEKQAHDAKVEALDHLLDEIDVALKDALDENQSAEAFLKSYVQKGGE